MANLFTPKAFYGAPQQPQPVQPAKLGLLDRLGRQLVPGDSQWSPSDDERKAMMKRGLLEAGLTMLATPTGAGNSPVMGIARGLLAGQQGVRADAEDARSKALGLDQMRYGNAAPAKIREIQQGAVMLGYKPGTPDYDRYVQTQFGLAAKATNMSEWKTSVTASGEIIRTNEAGGAQILDRNTRTWNDLATGDVPTEDVAFSSLPPAEQDAVTRVGNGLSGHVAVKDGKAYDVTASGGYVPPPVSSIPPPSRAPLPAFVKPEAPAAVSRPMTPQEISAYGLPAGTSATIDSKGAVSVLNKPAVTTPEQQMAAQRKADGAKEMSRILKTMLDEYEALDKANGITNTDRGVWDNIGAYARASDTGQVFGRMAGSKDQSARDTINAMKPQVLSAVIAASGMSAKQLDSNAEMKLWLSATSDPQTSYQTVRKVTDNLLKKFTGMGLEQFDAKQPPRKPLAPPAKNNRESLLDKY